MKTQKEIKSLIWDCVALLREEGYSELRIADYLRFWSNGIQAHMNENSLVNYQKNIGESFLSTIPVRSASYLRAIRRSVHILDDVLLFGKIRKRSVHLVRHELLGDIGKIAIEFLTAQEKIRRSKLTVENHRRILSYFVIHLSLQSVNQISEIKDDDVLSFLSSAQNSKDKYLNTIRLFCRFLYNQNYTRRNMEYIIGRNLCHTHEKLPSVYDSDEIKCIENTIEQSSTVGKRDYAILLLTTRLGLRSSDIAGLTFSNLNWDKNIITLEQYKTKKIIELPLLIEVGEAIINYLKYGRPQTDLQQVFLTATAPYRPINRLIINGAISRNIIASKVDIKGRKFGPHAMRHTLASQLLSKGTSLPLISETLGHSSTQSTMNYLRIDVHSLMQCALDVPLVSKNFYEQKGGVFYA